MARKTKDVRNITLSDFYCTKCGMKGIPVFRTIGQEREPGHLKKLFCLHCQEETNMAEVGLNTKVVTLHQAVTALNLGKFLLQIIKRRKMKHETFRIKLLP